MTCRGWAESDLEHLALCVRPQFGHGDTVAVVSDTFPCLERGKIHRPTGEVLVQPNIFLDEHSLVVTVKPYGPQGGDVRVALRPDELELLERAAPAPEDDGDDWSDQLTGYAAMAASAMAGGTPAW